MKKKLVLVGGSQYPTGYSAQIHAVEDNRIVFPGYVYDQDILRELSCNCLAYIHGNEVGGTNPGLLNAMASGCFVISRDVSFNREVLQDGGVYFQKDIDSLRERLAWALENPQKLGDFAAKGQKIIQKHYNWDSVATAYEELFNLIYG